MNRLRSWLLLIACALTIAILPVNAQKSSGTVNGQVTDISGAAVANVPVTLTNAEAGTTRSINTNDQGIYTFEEVPNGVYQLQVKAPNFKEFVVNQVTVNVANTTRVDAKLQPGSVTETISVVANEVQVQTDEGSLGTVVDGTQVRELPLNGRSFVELTQLAPGVSGANNFDAKNKGLQGGVDFSVNGNPTTNNLFLVDGANDNDVGSNRTILIYPSNEAIAEFKMLTNSYGPEYGQASGAVISIVTRSGTNDFHGSAFYSGRNNSLAAYSYFAARNAGKSLPLNGKDKLRRNDWGYSIGGPIKKDKLFFFWNQEWNHEIRGFTQSACVPTAAERAGDFSQVVAVHVDPTNGTKTNVMSCGEVQPTFPAALTNGNPHILANVEKAGQLLAEYYPLPNLPLNDGGNNWSQSLPSGLYWREENARVDFNLNKTNTIMGRYTQDSWSNPSYNGNQYWGDSPFPALNGSWSQPSKMVIGRWTDSITNSLVNDLEFAYSNNRINITPGGSDPTLLSQLSAAIAPLYPESLKTAKQSTPTIWGGLGNYGSGANLWSLAPWNNTLDLYTFRDDVSKVAGRHVIKFGAFVGVNGKNEDTGASSQERPTFGTGDGSVDTKNGGVATTNNLANVLIPGNPFLLSEVSTNVRSQVRWKDIEFYVGDNFKVTPRVTLDYGLRYSFLRAATQPNNQLTNFQPQLYDPSKPASDACNGLWIVKGTDPCGDANKKFGTHFSSGTPGPGSALVNNNNHLIAPRVGIAWDVFGNGKTAVRAGVGQFFQRERVSRYTLTANAPFAVNASNVSRALGGPTPSSLGGASASPDGGIDPAALFPNSWQWNLTVEQSLAKNTVLQVSYVGNRGIHLTSDGDINAIPAANWMSSSFVTGGAQQKFRPYSNFGTLTYWTHHGDSNYNAMQTLFRTRLSSFQLQAAYTWSHAISTIQTDNSDGGISFAAFTDPTNPGFDRGNAPTNRSNIFVANGTYFAPKLNGANAFERGVLGGWEVSGITTADSGNSFTIYQANINENVAAVRANAPGANSLSALVQTGYTNMLRPAINPGQSCGSGVHADQIINPKAFTLIGYPIGTFPGSTEPRGYCPGPHLVNTDLSLDKNWTIKERVTIQFRMDAFDLFNHANFRQDTNFNGTPFSNVNCGPQTNGFYEPCSATNNVITAQSGGQNFGKANALVGNAGRQFQYGLHITF
jgi:hypothetical protein